MMRKKLISLGIPCFNEELNIVTAYKSLNKIISGSTKYNFEFIFVDNGSTDNTRELIKKVADKDKRVIGVFLSRNFGPEASGQATLDYANGDAYIGIHCDLQDPPEIIKKFMQKWEAGYDVVVGIYTKSNESYLTSFLRKNFYRFFEKISNIKVPINASGVGLLDKKALNALRVLPEKYRFFRGLRAWIGFKTAYITYERRKRTKGKSSYSFFDYFKHAERGLFGFSYLVLDLMVYGGFTLVFFSFVFFLVYLFTVLIIGNPINASIPLMLAIVFFGGVQLLAISIIGKYIQVIVEETKNRPVYIVDEIINKK